MEARRTIVVPWCVAGSTTLHGYDTDLVYILVRAETDDPRLQRNIALVSAWDLEGERYARMIAALPRLLMACQAVVRRWEHGNLAEVAQMCTAAVAEATGEGEYAPDAFKADPRQSREQMIELLLAKAEQSALESADLDAMVPELAASIAADINNGGLEAQIDYLVDQLGGQEAGKQLKQLAEEKSHNDECQ